MDYEYFMSLAVLEAKKAGEIDEIPIGCVIVYEGEVIAKGHNRRNIMKNTLYHAEISAINTASRKIGDWRLEDCVLFVTVEPCPMCAGAIVQARIKEVVFGTRNKKAGCFGSILNLCDYGFNHRVIITEGILKDECAALMTDFFKRFRGKKQD